jgi:polygalacturonase
MQFKNSPRFHILTSNIDGLEVDGIDIHVDTDAQHALINKYAPVTNKIINAIFKHIPLFPLNTDGIDPSGVNVTIRNSSITNFDDAVAVKPASGRDAQGNRICAENMFIQNVKVKYSVGMSIGSITAHPFSECIRNITFKDISFERPLKAI